MRIRYLEAGEGNPGPPLVMIHGYLAGADYWFPHTLPALSREFRVIAPDLPGYGYSDSMAEHNLSSYAWIMNRFMDDLELSEVLLMGHSMGGQVAVAAAAGRPERVKALLLVDSAGLPQGGPAWRKPVQMLTDASMRHIRMYPVILRLNSRARARKEGLKMMRYQHITSLLKTLTMPTLIIWGSRDRVIPVEHGSLLARLIPNARLAVIVGAGHMPFYHKSKEFNRIAAGFLRRAAGRQEDPVSS